MNIHNYNNHVNATILDRIKKHKSDYQSVLEIDSEIIKY